MAGNGWLRGVQQTRRPLVYVVAGLVVSGILCPVLVHGLLGAPRLELEGSAVANVVGQVVMAALFVWALVRSRVPLAPHIAIMKAQLVLGRDLIARSLAFQACFVSAAAVASRFGAASVAAHQLVLQLWSFLALTLDSLAIAAQTLVGAALGAGNARGAQGLARRITGWSTVFAVVLAVIFAAGYAVIPQLFTTDPSVLDRTHVVWWFFVGIIPIAGVVFALDGVLLGAGDAAFLRNATLGSALLGFLPAIWLSLVYDWGIAGIWTGLVAFMLLRLVAVSWRALSGKWARVGANVAGATGLGVLRRALGQILGDLGLPILIGVRGVDLEFEARRHLRFDIGDIHVELLVPAPMLIHRPVLLGEQWIVDAGLMLPDLDILQESDAEALTESLCQRL